MSVTVIATPADPLANSYCTVEEADAYHDARLHATDWLVSGDVKAAAVVMATRLLDAYYSWTGSVLTAPPTPGLPQGAYRAWTGAASTETQALCWPRTGMYSRNGYALGSGEIPQPLKDATAEFARQLIAADRTLDSDAEVQGLRSVRAGSVTIAFRDMITSKAIPDAVHTLLVPSWTTVYGGMSPFKVI